MTKAPKEEPHFRRVALVGVGLLGGSLGLAIREHKLADHVVGVGRNPDRLAKAVERGAVDSYSLDLAQAAAESDLVILCGPVATIIEQIPVVMAAAPEGTLITDVGSTKRSIVECAALHARDGVTFVGSHPIAGSDKSGIESARTDLYSGATVLLTPDLDTPAPALARIAAFWQALGMRVLEVAPAHHDHLLAALSHLPHLVAAALVSQVEVSLDESPSFLKQVAGPGFRETTRIAMGSVPMWLDICQENSEAILRSLDATITLLLELRKSIAQNNREDLRHFLAAAEELRKEF